MDPFDDVNSIRVESSLYVRFQLRAPWGVSFDTRDMGRLVVIARGSCWLVWEGQNQPTRVMAGDCFIIKAGTVFSLQDDLERDIVPCDTIFTQHLGRTVQYGGDGVLTEIISGVFSFDAIASEPLMVARLLLPVMPQLVHVRLEDTHSHLLQTTLQLMGLETNTDGLGAGLVINRLADVLFVQAVRAWCAKEGERAAGWLAGLRDRRLSAAIKAMHGDLAFPWTVESLARQAGLSRSSFASAFKAVIGETPLDYLTGWRMYRAKDLLRGSDLGLMEIAERVGYDTDTALSRAFRRFEGIPPGEWRRRMSGPALPGSSAAIG